MCFTGRFNRLVNCLNGYSEYVKIEIKTNEQVGNLVFITKEKLESKGEYTLDKHLELFEKEMKERNYSKEEIEEWKEYIKTEFE